MTRLPDEEDAIVSLGRAAMAPSAVDRARVRASLTHALATLDAPPNAPEASSAGDLGSAAKLASPQLALAKLWATRVLVGAVLSGGGYWAGYRAGLREPTIAPGSPTSAATVAALAVPAASIAASAEPEPVRVAREPPPPARGSNSARRAEALPQPPSAPQVPIDEELRTLRRAEHALRQGNPRLALVLLEELSRSTRGGRLLEERTAEMVVARCALEPSEAERLRLEFEQAHSNSVYLDRVRQSCAPH